MTILLRTPLYSRSANILCV